MPAPAKTLYDILKVKPTAEPSEIKAAYRKLAFELHPDRNKGDQSKTNQFKEVCAAYAILSDSDRRKAYDLEIAVSAPGSDGRPRATSIFGPLFDDLVSRVSDEGITSKNADSLFKSFLDVATDVQKRVPQQARQAAKSPANMMDLFENIFDAKIAFDKKMKRD